MPFAIVLVTVASDTPARIVVGLRAVLTLALAGYSLVWMIRGLLTEPFYPTSRSASSSRCWSGTGTSSASSRRCGEMIPSSRRNV